MGRKKKRKASKSKIRVFMSFVVCCFITVALGFNCYNTISKIQDMKKEKKNLENQLVVLEEEKETLETDIMKLEDPDYIAKYVREKYFYSKDGELILRLDQTSLY